jgi:indolepyruvate decarboxylase
MNLTESLLHALKATAPARSSASPAISRCPISASSRIADPAAVHAVARAGGRLRRGCCGAHRMGLGVAAVTYGAGALNMINCGGRGLCREVAAGGALRRAGQGRGQAPACCCTIRPRRWIRSSRSSGRSPATRYVLDDAERAPADIARVLANCLRIREPVYIEIPRDMVAVPCAPVPPKPRRWSMREALDACVGRNPAAPALRSVSPVLMVGVEVRRFGLEEKVAELARRLGLPVVTSFMGRGLLAEPMRRWSAPTWAWPGCRK